jgi:threonine dehydrogenase-like Zn-dependent dehydrogenase
MKAAVYYGAGDIRIEQVADPSPGPRELLLEIHGELLDRVGSHLSS